METLFSNYFNVEIFSYSHSIRVTWKLLCFCTNIDLFSNYFNVSMKSFHIVISSVLHESFFVSVQILILFYSMQEEKANKPYLPSMQRFQLRLQLLHGCRYCPWQHHRDIHAVLDRHSKDYGSCHRWPIHIYVHHDWNVWEVAIVWSGHICKPKTGCQPSFQKLKCLKCTCYSVMWCYQQAHLSSHEHFTQQPLLKYFSNLILWHSYRSFLNIGSITFFTICSLILFSRHEPSQGCSNGLPTANYLPTNSLVSFTVEVILKYLKGQKKKSSYSIWLFWPKYSHKLLITFSYFCMQFIGDVTF